MEINPERSFNILKHPLDHNFNKIIKNKTRFAILWILICLLKIYNGPYEDQPAKLTNLLKHILTQKRYQKIPKTKIDLFSISISPYHKLYCPSIKYH